MTPSPRARTASSSARTVIIGLGNDLLADDAVGVFAARELRRLRSNDINVVETSLHGVALLDLLVGYDEAIVMDAIQTGRHPVGTIVEVNPAELRPIEPPSPHYTGLPELLVLATRLELPFPRRIHILAMEARDLITIGGAMSPEVLAAIPELCRRVEELTRLTHALNGTAVDAGIVSSQAT